MQSYSELKDEEKFYWHIKEAAKLLKYTLLKHFDCETNLEKMTRISDGFKSVSVNSSQKDGLETRLIALIDPDKKTLSQIFHQPEKYELQQMRILINQLLDYHM